MAYSTMYEMGIYAASLFYFLSGLFLIKKTLSRFYNENVVAFTLFVIALGTNLFYYASLDFAMSHCYSFFLFSLFLYLLIKWHDNPSFKNTLLIGFTAGLITVVRPSNILILLVFFLYGVIDKETFQKKVLFLTKHFKLLLVMLLCFVIAAIPQLIYWKTVSGRLIFDSYPYERFYFSNPHVLQGLFGFRKGWFIYTPLMLLVIPGFFYSIRSKKPFATGILVFSIINIYVVFSWWTWWYGGSFSSRAMVESYALLALPLASFFDRIGYWSRFMQKVVYCVAIALTLLNIFQTYQYSAGIIDFQRMTFREYRNIFGRTTFPDNYFKLLKEPDIDYAQRGLRNAKETFLMLRKSVSRKVSIKAFNNKYVLRK